MCHQRIEQQCHMVNKLFSTSIRVNNSDLIAHFFIHCHTFYVIVHRILFTLSASCSVTWMQFEGSAWVEKHLLPNKYNYYSILVELNSRDVFNFTAEGPTGGRRTRSSADMPFIYNPIEHGFDQIRIRQRSQKHARETVRSVNY